MKLINLNLNSSDATLFYTEEIIQGENLATQLNINLTEEFQGYRYLILFQNNDNICIPTEELFPVNNVISYLLTNNMTKDAGILKLEIQAFNEDGLLIKTAARQLKVIESLDGATDVIPDIYIPWYTVAIQAATTATEQAEIATNKAEEASDKLNEIVTVNTELADNISVGITLNDDLENNIITGNTLKTNLDNNISTGNTLNNNLGNNISTGNTLDTNLGNKISTGNTLNANLTNNISVGTTLNTNLTANISTGNTTKTNLQNTITTAQTIIANGLTIDGGTF